MPTEAKITRPKLSDAEPYPRGMSLPGAPGAELHLGALLDMLARHADLPLVFFYNNREIRAGYHVTEVKSGRFESLDCGANPESWGETFIQLWDIEEAGKIHMKAAKFAAILGKVEASLGLDRENKLTFEVSDGYRPMQLLAATQAEVRGGAIHVPLVPRAASCKPRDRWLESPRAGTVPPTASCCGAPAPNPARKACCG